MNDFTKKELNILHEFLDTACELYSEPDSTYSLRDKIQSMIDNYCEHKNKCVNGAKLVCEDCEKEW